MIGNINEVSHTILGAVEEQRRTSNEVEQAISDSSKAITVVSTSVRESATAGQEIARNIADVDSAAKEFEKEADKTQTFGADLKTVCNRLHLLLETFKINKEEPTP